MDLLRNGRHGTNTFRILIQPVWLIHTHWRNKTLLCPGAGCTLCKAERPKMKAYTVGAMAQHRGSAIEGLMELADTTWSQLSKRGCSTVDAAGWSWVQEMRRDSKQWKILSATRAEVEPQDPWLLHEALEVLYRLPRAVTPEGDLATATTAADFLDLHNSTLMIRNRWALEGQPHPHGASL